MENDNAALVARDLKQLLDDHDGELAYWGEKIILPVAPAPVAAVVTAPVPASISVSSPLAGVGRVRGAGTGQNPSLKTSNVGASGPHPGPLPPFDFAQSRQGEREHDNKQDKIVKLESVRLHSVGDCHLCPLGDTRIKIVFGVGNPHTEVMFVGEGPGFDENRKGEPFVGKAGMLLDKIMAAIQLDRTKVYIANVVKCHPMVDATQPDKRGNDRPPSPEEIEKCRPFLMEQIRIINPKLIVTLGATATKAVLQTRQGISAIRGRIFDVELIPGLPPFRVLPTFHPAALLRDETLKRPVWEDMKKLQALLK
jgi:DNA polymerase